MTITALDDHPIITDGLVCILEQNGDFQLISIAHSWEQLISHVQEKVTDILILYLNIRGENVTTKIND